MGGIECSGTVSKSILALVSICIAIWVIVSLFTYTDRFMRSCYNSMAIAACYTAAACIVLVLSTINKWVVTVSTVAYMAAMDYMISL